jgi:exopolysaccharide production protein ExoY
MSVPFFDSAPPDYTSPEQHFATRHDRVHAIASTRSWPYPINGTSEDAVGDHDFATDRMIATKLVPPVGGWLKRTLDIVIALLSIILLSPLMIIVMGLIKVTMGGPVIFAHSRIGYNGRPFRCYKFRTMVANAEQILGKYLENDPCAAREWREIRKLRNDPRITILGRLLRKSSIDELPQFFNVLRGDMSCVGPRPIVAEELPRYGRYVEEYLKTRPGMTGIWQVSGRNTISYGRRVALDCRYVRNWSIWLDAVILIKTIFVLTKFEESA